jgi:hypothetical protein
MKTCGKTMAKVGSHLEGFLTAAENKRMEETCRGQGYPKVNF